MDVEWGLDGADGGLYILQARPETVQSRAGSTVEKYHLASRGTVRVEGRAIGAKIGAGRVRVLEDIDRMHDFQAGEVLVADMTDPDWEPIMKRASAIVTNRGGRTCHAAIIARELGIPAVVGTGTATRELADGDEVTVSAAEGDTGFVYEGELEFTVATSEVDSMPELPVKIMMNVGTPAQAFAFSRLPNAGVGLARLEFIVNRQIGIHPRALLELDRLDTDEPEVAAQVRAQVAAYASPRDYFVQRVAEGVATIAAAFAPEPVIVRMSDFKSNEYANLLGGTLFEPHEENPMIGYRGASRYLSEDFAECFAMECEALRYVREDMGLTNVKLMIPFVRTPAEGKGVIDLLATHGLVRGENDLQVIMMCEIPSNAATPELFLEHFDGFSIGSNDMTQLTLGLDRDSGLVADAFDERDPGREVHALPGHRGLPGGREVRGDLRAGPVGPPRFRAVADGSGHRLDVPEPGHGGRHVAAARTARRRRGGLLRTQSSSRTRSSSLVWVPGVLWLSAPGTLVTVVRRNTVSSSASTEWR